MSSTVIMALLLGVMLSIIASFLVCALQARRRHMQRLAIATQVPVDPLDVHGTMILHMHDGIVMGVEKPAPLSSFTLPPSWYSRWRTLVSVSFLLMVLLTLFVQSGLAAGTLQRLSRNFSILSKYRTTDIKTSVHPLPLTASMRIVRVDSALRNQYNNDYQWQVWSYSSCSGIAMEEVMNAYGRHLIASDVLQVEQNMGVWNTNQGLTGGETAVARVANYFGFKADPNPPRTISDLIAVANKGFPVIVDIPGHILVVRGGDSNYVYLVDSAPANRKLMTHTEFLSIWRTTFSVVLTPQ